MGNNRSWLEAKNSRMRQGLGVGSQDWVWFSRRPRQWTMDREWCLPEWRQSWGESHGATAVRVVIVQAEPREVGGHVLF